MHDHDDGDVDVVAVEVDALTKVEEYYDNYHDDDDVLEDALTDA